MPLQTLISNVCKKLSSAVYTCSNKISKCVAIKKILLKITYHFRYFSHFLDYIAWNFRESLWIFLFAAFFLSSLFPFSRFLVLWKFQIYFREYWPFVFIALGQFHIRHGGSLNLNVYKMHACICILWIKVRFSVKNRTESTFDLVEYCVRISTLLGYFEIKKYLVNIIIEPIERFLLKFY